MTPLMTRKLHAYIDYPVALGLIILPFILGLGSSNPMAFGISVVTGLAVLATTALTEHETGLFKLLPYSLHLAVDAVVGAVFVATPFVLGLTGLDAAYFWAIGAAVLVVVSLHSPAQKVVF